jgi:hypothetical protein
MENPAKVSMKTDISITKQNITESPLTALPGGSAASGLDKAYKILLDALGFEPPSTNAQYTGPACRALTKSPWPVFLGFGGPLGLRVGGAANHMDSLR